MSDDSDSMMGDLNVAFLLMIAWILWAVWAGSCQESSRFEQSILPVHQPQQYGAVYQLPPPPPPPSESYRSSPYIPPARQPEQHRPVSQPPPPPPSPSESYRSSPYTPPAHQPQQYRPVSQPPPPPPSPSESYHSSPYIPPARQPEQRRPVSQPPPPPPSPSESYRSSPYIPPARQPEQRRPVSQPPPPPPSPSESYRSSSYTPPAHQPEQHRPVSQPPPPPPSPSESYQSSPYIPPAPQLEQHRPVSQPPPSQSYQSSPYIPPVHQPEQHQPVSQPPPHRPPPSQSYASSPYTPPLPHGPPKYEDDNRKDKQNDYYVNLRARANKEGDEMARCFSESREAYSRGNRAAAKDLSNQGKNHKQKMEQLHKEASDWIYLENNRDSKPGEIDLHGLYVKEAIAHTDAALKEAKLRGDSEIRLIVGKGTHSEGGEAKLRPAIMGRMRKYQLPTESDPSNSGVLVVELNGLPRIRHRQHLSISHRRSRRHRQRTGNIGA